MTSFSHREFTDSLITQELTLCQVVDYVYNMDIYNTNMDPVRNWSYHQLLLIYYVIILLQKFTKSPISHNSVNVQDKQLKIISQIHFKFLDTMTKVWKKISSHHAMMT